jgi:hypothetical protein
VLGTAGWIRTTDLLIHSLYQVFDITRGGAKCHPANLMVPAFFLDRPKPCGPLSKGRWQGPLSRLAAFRPLSPWKPAPSPPLVR